MNITGLTTSEVIEKQKQGKNEFSQKKKRSVFLILFEQFKSPLILLLTVAGLISFAIGENVDGGIIIFVVILNCIIGAVQEISAEKSVEKLKQLSISTAVVYRDGKRTEIPSTELVVGDYVILEAGFVVPADLRLSDCASLKINEATLTGESLAVEKDPNVNSNEKTPLGDRKDFAFMSTLVEYGRGAGIVEAIGDNTQIGKISTMLNTISKKETPLQKNLNEISKILGFAGVILCIIMFFFQTKLFQLPFLETLMTSIAFAVAVIPEGLATVVTFVLSIGVQKMSKRNAIVKQLHSVETLGAVNVICSDKTGTLTQNKMTVVKWYYNNKSFLSNEIDKDNSLFLSLLNGFYTCNDASYSLKSNEELGDPTEIAFIKYIKQNYSDYKLRFFRGERIDEIPFDSSRKMMTTLNKTEKGIISYTKGSIDIILEHCNAYQDEKGIHSLTLEKKNEILLASEKMSDDALRVLALAYRTNDYAPKEEDMIFLGFAGMIDPPKEGVKETIEQCHHAGIDVAMITGDHKNTAFAIAKELSIATDISECISGQEIDKMNINEFAMNILNYHVFARVSPEHKVRIVQAFQSQGKICSMTGDGVNDAPSLKAANIGVAMGKGGTEVAKDAADMILVDDNFITIKNAVMEGRNLFNNIKKSVIYLLRSNFGEVVLMACTVFSGFVTPLSTIHILWVNLFTDTVPSLALGMDKSSDDVMNEKPRNVKKGLLLKKDYQGIIIQGIICGLTALFAFMLPAIMKYGFNNLEMINKDSELLMMCRTYCFTVLVVNELLMTYVCKNYKITTKEFWNNNIINFSVFGGIIIQMVVLITPITREILKLSVCSLKDILFMLLVSFLGVSINYLLSKKRK